MARKPTKAQDAQKKLMTWIGIVTLIAGIAAAGLVVGTVRLWRGITRLPEFRVRPGEIEFDVAFVRPEKMKEDFVRTDEVGVLSTECSIFTSGLTQDVAKAYAASPWVRRVRSVRKVFPNSLAADLELRAPYAVVASGTRRCCVDRDGVVLSPSLYQLTPDLLDTLNPDVIVPDGLPAPIAGYVWDDLTVKAGLKMVALCREQFGDQIAVQAVEIARAGDNAGGSAATAELVLDAGPRVQWGRVPLGPASPAEIATEQKAAALRTVVAREGNNLGRLRTINVRWRPTLIKPTRQGPVRPDAPRR